MKPVFRTLLCVPMGIILWTGCVKEEESAGTKPETQQVQPADSVWTVNIQAVREESPETKGLAIGDGDAEETTETLRSIWKANEQVLVYLGTDCIGTLTATPNASDAHKATLSGTVTAAGITPGVTRLTLLTPRQNWDYTGQVGRLLLMDDPNNQGNKNRSIEKKYHYTMAQNVLVTEASANGGKCTLTTEDAGFANQQSIYRLSFRFQKGGVGDKFAIEAKRIRITAAGGGLVLSQGLDGSSVTGTISVVLDEATQNPFFVALRNNNVTDEEALRFRVMDNEGVTYYGSKTIPAAYKPNGTFVSMKNATLTQRLGFLPGSESVDTVL